jgi:hypothetical protein
LVILYAYNQVSESLPIKFKLHVNTNSNSSRTFDVTKEE